MANALNQDLTDKIVLVDGRRFKCEGGFGCRSFCSGQKIFGRFQDTGEEATISGYDVEALAP